MQAVLPPVPPDCCRLIAYLRLVHLHRKVFQALKLVLRNRESQARKLALRNQGSQARKLALRNR